MLKNAALAVLLIIAAAGSATMVAQAQSGGEVEIRITAQRLEDGRTEFALQQRDGDGWSDRIAPRSRFLPAEPPVDRWLVSTPVTVAAPVEQTQSGGEFEVRITAQRLEDGRTEFALQQREGDGWSERVAPRSRFLPAEPPVDRWLVSTPVTITAPALTATPAPMLMPPVVVRSVSRIGETNYWAAPDSLTDRVQTKISTRADASALVVECSDLNGDGITQRLSVWILDFEGDELEWLEDRPFPNTPATHRLDDDDAVVQVWGMPTLKNQVRLYDSAARDFVESMRGKELLRVRLAQGFEIHSFNIAHLFDTPVQANIDKCG